MASAWFAGIAAGPFAVVFSTLLVDYFFVPPVHPGVNPKNETVREDALCRKGTASGKETVFGALPAGASGAIERMREHRGTRRGAGSIAASALIGGAMNWIQRNPWWGNHLGKSRAQPHCSKR